MFPQQHQSTADAVTITTLVDVAATVERRLQEAEARAEKLQRELRQLQQQHEYARRWIDQIRKCHRSHSHAATTRCIKDAIARVGRPYLSFV